MQSFVAGHNADDFLQVCRAKDGMPDGTIPVVRLKAIQQRQSLDAGGDEIIQGLVAVLGEITARLGPGI